LAALHDGSAKTTPKALKSRSCNRVRDVLRNMLNDAMRDGPVSRNVAELTKPLPLDDVSKTVIIKRKHFRAFVEMCENQDMGALWMLALCTGQAGVGTPRAALAGPRLGTQGDPGRAAVEAAARPLVPRSDQDRRARREHDPVA